MSHELTTSSTHLQARHGKTCSTESTTTVCLTSTQPHAHIYRPDTARRAALSPQPRCVSRAHNVTHVESPQLLTLTLTSRTHLQARHGKTSSTESTTTVCLTSSQTLSHTHTSPICSLNGRDTTVNCRFICACWEWLQYSWWDTLSWNDQTHGREVKTSGVQVHAVCNKHLPVH